MTSIKQVSIILSHLPSVMRVKRKLLQKYKTFIENIALIPLKV
ncbi:hypothetical protein CHCC20488_1539 [Bacillus paralicheniformis]|nr:hypothetical protein CHCC20497_1290 [Bacillus paralicheniformis]TWK45098.1 hypothetical protein CHCC20347_1304 [Bacillus paralicheniformis]TWN41687.1 hypothetical protein CHCC14523_0741 [Bacillus paralicheniformis]TWN89167.1 hypothetical protein CHCC20492_1957 [Bacillus paralicheniformis]TWN99751.1 hypothetical protein CHCC20488_1539 [Bacillus paralicheniformis]